MKRRNIKNKILRHLAGALCILFLPFGASCGKKEETKKPAEYGTYGSDFAMRLAREFPYRNAFSSGEKGAGSLIENELTKIGYKVEKQDFAAPGGKSSSNYIVRIEGEGFMQRDSFGEYSKVRKTVVIAAHYDSPISYEIRGSFPSYDGIQDNACGVGALMTIAKQMYGKKYGYDVIIVALGASSSGYLGAKAFLKSMGDDKDHCDCMYCIESIYAGDKLYAHAGLSSLQDGKKYSFRRKLYEAYDVSYENSVYSNTGVDLNYNMSLLSFDVDGDGKIDMYREVTKVPSDYLIFDSASIPVVFFESSDYNFSKLEDMKETKNLELQAQGGQIRGTALDSSEILQKSLDKDRLKVRINVTSFITIKAVEKGSQNCVVVSDYEAGQRLEPTVVPKKSKVTSTTDSSETTTAVSTEDTSQQTEPVDG